VRVRAQRRRPASRSKSRRVPCTTAVNGGASAPGSSRTSTRRTRGARTHPFHLRRARRPVPRRGPDRAAPRPTGRTCPSGRVPGRTRPSTCRRRSLPVARPPRPSRRRAPTWPKPTTPHVAAWSADTPRIRKRAKRVPRSTSLHERSGKFFYHGVHRRAAASVRTLRTRRRG
jgi:hypothetical protein